MCQLLKSSCCTEHKKGVNFMNEYTFVDTMLFHKKIVNSKLHLTDLSTFI